MGGIRFVTGHPDRPPVRAGISLGDSIAAMYGVIGALMAVHARAANGGRGQVVDVALYESVFSLMQLRGLPGWAALSTSGLKNLMLPRAVKRVLIAVDHDKNGTGEAAAREAGHRWLLEDREVRLARPPGFGDWNDVLRGKCDA